MTSKLNKTVFLTSSALIILLALFASIFPQVADTFFKNLQAVIVENGSWFYVLSVAIILITVAFLAFSKYGDIKLGPDHSTSDYSNLSWFAMLFSAGMGIGLMFFGVAEPVMHFLSPPVGEGNSVESAREAMRITFFHWGLHAWAIYAIVAIILAFFSYRHNLPLTLRSALYPIIGDKIYGPIGHAVDIFAVIGTLFGVATSLGYGVLQVNTGLNYLWDVPVNPTTQVILILVITALATLSVTTGLDKGIKRLSETNLILAVGFMLFILIVGPTVFLLQAYVQNIGSYASNILSSTFNLFAYEKTDWIGGWTILYWAWWISWSPFVGLFIARISRGRTIREFTLGVLLVPTGFTLMWMTFFGNSAINLILADGITQLGTTVSNDVTVALFAFLENFPFSGVTSVIATIMVIVFFVTSSDSGSMVIDMLCSNGNDNTPIWQRVYWAAGEGIVASILILAGGLAALQTMTIASALPFSLVLLVATYGLIKALRLDIAKKESLQYSTTLGSSTSNPEDWDKRLNNIVNYPTKKNVRRFLEKVAKPALEDVANVLRKNEFDVEVTLNDTHDKLTLVVNLGEESNFGENKNFLYQVKNISRIKPAFVYDEKNEEDRSEDELYYCAIVHLIEGGQDYDIMGWSKDGIRNDVVDQYEKHMHYMHLIN
ncbi:choline transporter [Malaciobacter pacificus]|uniref:BCCT (Betaine/carnitine/choline) family transporter n=1 Tax=Malaciobacter pacificus TaxID=1080223 RepID=A0A5C2HDU7_9BACT|nr:choline BCCT transporter BetT [Malaciobacter pacificus]QEP35336.1 BCCT (betaine/carnitine/choline) family transporter [Malaciobacter pacificus]GGD41873.1 choline transporter [Malaciobacter pacificus]